MKRLTEKREYPLTMSMWGGNSKDLNVYNRLAKIEDILGGDYDLDHLRELVQADRDRRCAVAPVKAGDTIYMTVPGTMGCNAVEWRYIERISDAIDYLETLLAEGKISKAIYDKTVKLLKGKEGRKD